jgi:hypothetical protein
VRPPTRRAPAAARAGGAPDAPPHPAGGNAARGAPRATPPARLSHWPCLKVWSIALSSLPAGRAIDQPWAGQGVGTTRWGEGGVREEAVHEQGPVRWRAGAARLPAAQEWPGATARSSPATGTPSSACPPNRASSRTGLAGWRASEQTHAAVGGQGAEEQNWRWCMRAGAEGALQARPTHQGLAAGQGPGAARRRGGARFRGGSAAGATGATEI